MADKLVNDCRFVHLIVWLFSTTVLEQSICRVQLLDDLQKVFFLMVDSNSFDIILIELFNTHYIDNMPI